MGRENRVPTVKRKGRFRPPRSPETPEIRQYFYEEAAFAAAFSARAAP
jgi:hypothetical protein